MWPGRKPPGVRTETGRILALSSTTIPLIRAAAEGDAGAVRDLLAGGADVNASTMKGETALMRAAFFGHAEVVRLLLQAGADVGMKDGFDLTAV